VSKHHLETWPEKRIVVIEAREFCSGATGRNAGHCKPDRFRHFAKFEAQFGAEQALKIQQSEQASWEGLVKYVQENGVGCDLWIGETLDVPLDDEVAKLAEETLNNFKNAGGVVGNLRVINDPVEAANVSRIKSAKACYAWPASTLQPWKLTAHIMRNNLNQGVNLQTYTTVRLVTESKSGSRKWIVHTDRGEVACDTVVYASNAYTAAIEPSFKGIITPKPHMCNKFVPPRTFSGSKALKNSYGVLLSNGALHSINPRCIGDGAVMFGGSNPGQKALDKWVEEHPEHCIDDSFASIEMVAKHAREFADAEFHGWGEADFGPGEGFDYSWSGIIGLSADGVPLIGEIPGKPGQWICAGHHGHGMARVFTAAPGLVKLMNGDSWQITGLPDVYQLTEERLDRLRQEGALKIAVA
jgi:glycine/D-amino acid oxidase-like deaminating enzyme